MAALKTIVEQTAERMILAAARGESERLIDSLLGDRGGYMHDATESVASLGPGCLPRLLEKIDGSARKFSWGGLRAVNSIATMAERFPGECDSAIPSLIEAIDYEANCELADACKRALMAIGPNVVERIAGYVGTDANVDRCLCEVLAAFPTERSSDIIIDLLEYEDYIEGSHIGSLEAIGHPDAVSFLMDRCDPDNPTAVEAVLTLCAINDLDTSEVDRWLNSVEERRAQRYQGVQAESSVAQRMDQTAWGSRSAGKTKTLSRAERKKRAKARLMNKRRKK